jgi:hypothetical protein
MKFLEVPNFATLSAHLSGTREGTRISCQIESYSLKPAGVDKKMYKDYNFTNGHSPDQMLALSPPQTTMFSTSADQMTNRKTVYHLLCTLNAAFPDYDFQHVDSKQFSKEPSLELVINSVNNTLRETNRDAFLAVQSELWAAIDHEIELPNCEIYSYIPMDDSDPFGEEGVVYVVVALSPHRPAYAWSESLPPSQVALQLLLLQPQAQAPRLVCVPWPQVRMFWCYPARRWRAWCMRSVF